MPELQFPIQPIGGIPERRRHRRVRTRIEAELAIENGRSPIRAHTSDLSLGGCYVEMMFTLPVGRRLRVSLWLNGNKTDFDAIIATADSQVGNGIKFINASGDALGRLQGFIDQQSIRRGF